MKKDSGNRHKKDGMILSDNDFRVLFESTAGPLVVYDPGINRVIMCNHAACKLFGYDKKEELLEQTPFSLSADYQPDGNHSSQALNGIIDRLKREKHVRGRWMYKTKDKRNLLADVQLSYIELSRGHVIFTYLNDITKEIEEEQSLRDSVFSLDAAVNGTGVGLWDWDIENDNLTLNDNWFDMLGFTRKDFERKYESFGYNTFADSVHPDDIEKMKRVLEEHFNHLTDYYRVEIRMRTAAEKWKWILAAGKVWVWKDDKPKRMVGIHTDIDYRFRMEEKLKKAKSRAEEGERLKSAFLANMSHEIRTPMNGIIGFMDLMENPDTTEEQSKQYRSIIRKSVQQLLDIVNEVMDMSKIEAGQIEFFETQTDLQDVLNDVRNQFSASVPDGVDFIIDREDGPVNNIIMVDRSKLRQIFSNLLSNAIRFTSSGEIRVGYSHDDDMLRFYVKDTGEGIAKEHHEIVFERFRQIDNNPGGIKGGTGLGLSICKAYVEKMGGKIWLESEKGKGSSFYFTIPYKAALRESKSSDSKDGGKSSEEDSLILVVEDELYNYLFVEHVLKSKGFRVLHAETGSQAIEYVSLYPDTRLVFMDIRLPDITGYKATAEIKKIKPSLPVIALTALALSGDRETAIKAGCDDYLKKPITRDKLLATATYFLDK